MCVSLLNENTYTECFHLCLQLVGDTPTPHKATELFIDKFKKKISSYIWVNTVTYTVSLKGIAGTTVIQRHKAALKYKIILSPHLMCYMHVWK
jgi:hypothetical protein